MAAHVGCRPAVHREPPLADGNVFGECQHACRKIGAVNAFHQGGGRRLVAGKNDPERAALREVRGGQEVHEAGRGRAGGSPVALEFVLGEVTQSGQFPYVSGMTVQTAVAIAGGFSPRAERDGVEVTRRFGDRIITGYVPLTYPLKPGDTVTVKERWF